MSDVVTAQIIAGVCTIAAAGIAAAIPVILKEKKSRKGAGPKP